MAAMSAAMSSYEARFGALGRLYGAAGLAHIRRAHVAVVGLGGVGSWLVEALARSGVGALTLVDLDEVCLSNINRQIHALDATVGRSKAEVLAERVASFAPDCVVTVENRFFTEATAFELLERDYTYVADAIDRTKHKCLLIAECRRRGLPVISCGGAGGRIDPARVRIADIARTINDPLMLQVRKRLRRDYGFPKHSRQKFKIDCVFTDELPRFPQPDGSVSADREPEADYRLNCDQGFGSATFLTGTFAFHMAAEIIHRIAE